MTVVPSTRVDVDAALVEALRREEPGRRRAARGALRRSGLSAGHAHHRVQRGRRGGGAGRAVDGRPQDSDVQGRVGVRLVDLSDHRQRGLPEAAHAPSEGAARSRWTTCCPSLDGDGRHFEPMDDWSNRVDEKALQGELRDVLTAGDRRAAGRLPDRARPARRRGRVEPRHRRDAGDQPAGREVARPPLAPLRPQAARRVPEDRVRSRRALRRAPGGASHGRSVMPLQEALGGVSPTERETEARHGSAGACRAVGGVGALSGPPP